MEIGALSHIGQKRKLNEDSYFISDGREFLYGFVADGMGGHQAGDIASSMACECIEQFLLAEFHQGMHAEEAAQIARKAFIEANYRIYCYAKSHSQMMGMGTTSTFAMIYDGQLITAHVGDSRVYAVTDSGIKRVTTDHSYVQELLARGEITEEMAQNHPKKNYITRAMGTEETIKIDIGICEYHNEVILICSDGLTNMVPDEQIKNVITHTSTLKEGVDVLVQIANDNGGTDNITVVAMRRIGG